MRCSRLTACHAPAVAHVSGETATGRGLLWTPQQLCYRQLMKSLRAAYFHDRSKLFWSRHRVLVEFYKYSGETDEEAIRQLVGIGLEVAAFIQHHMHTDVERIIKHNEKMLMLSADKAKKFRADYLLAEKQHDSWCKQKIKAILTRRPPPPYPFF
ncbi:hypothetical protein TraAM80_05456 [Trypanosoma rangeli]|uniref:Uncharacterized protein n=1 Tax=Trypanosoma rangeli TaxID=5698 RepID=A0A422NEQ0_TRYRA|nr:uncharacterized protein TraAM80_05456 [Trypanosoma rangeli]RNF03930.1 hypothetical protein TraAM80_05456 [Trypanosoma rangeli]|eukprot:RNF03930.1 hypothetical protein TraAM80_05456 [Trypanosoma rangeli]